MGKKTIRVLLDEAVTHLDQALVALNPGIRIVVLTHADVGSVPAPQPFLRFERVSVSARLDDLITLVRGAPSIGFPVSQ